MKRFWIMCENCIKRELKKENKSFSNLIETFNNPKYDYTINLTFSYDNGKIGRAFLNNPFCGNRKPEMIGITYDI